MGSVTLEPILSTVIFDVDGTLADTERDGHRVAFNRAFEHLGLPDRWDEGFYGQLLSVGGGKQRLLHYFQSSRPILEKEAERLATELHRLKNEAFKRLIEEGSIPLRPGVLQLLDELHREGITVAVATTGSGEWVGPLLRRLLGEERAARFTTVVTGEQVSRHKPDPQIYRLALNRLGCPATEALAIEDSHNGALAAKRAGLTCLVVCNSYSEDHDLSMTDLVVDGFGGLGTPPRVLHNPYGIEVGTVVAVETLRQLHSHRGGADSVTPPALKEVQCCHGA